MIDSISFLWGMLAGMVLFGIFGHIAYRTAIKKQIIFRKNPYSPVDK
jgi:hypothetical protein